jgi:hypothetical protein
MKRFWRSWLSTSRTTRRSAGIGTSPMASLPRGSNIGQGATSGPGATLGLNDAWRRQWCISACGTSQDALFHLHACSACCFTRLRSYPRSYGDGNMPRRCIPMAFPAAVSQFMSSSSFCCAHIRQLHRVRRPARPAAAGCDPVCFTRGVHEASAGCMTCMQPRSIEGGGMRETLRACAARACSFLPPPPPGSPGALPPRPPLVLRVHAASHPPRPGRPPSCPSLPSPRGPVGRSSECSAARA